MYLLFLRRPQQPPPLAAPPPPPPARQRPRRRHNMWVKSYTLISLTVFLSSGKITESKSFSFIANLKIKVFFHLKKS